MSAFCDSCGKQVYGDYLMKVVDVWNSLEDGGEVKHDNCKDKQVCRDCFLKWLFL